VLLDDVNRLTGFQDLPVVGAVLLGQLAGKEIEIRLPPDLVEGRSQLGAAATDRPRG
jgi:hypothetical protein